MKEFRRSGDCRCWYPEDSCIECRLEKEQFLRQIAKEQEALKKAEEATKAFKEKQEKKHEKLKTND